jgi:hypothetical protein
MGREIESRQGICKVVALKKSIKDHFNVGKCNFNLKGCFGPFLEAIGRLCYKILRSPCQHSKTRGQKNFEFVYLRAMIRRSGSSSSSRLPPPPRVTRCVLEKKRPNCSPILFCQRQCINFTVFKSSPTLGYVRHFERNCST